MDMGHGGRCVASPWWTWIIEIMPEWHVDMCIALMAWSCGPARMKFMSCIKGVVTGLIFNCTLFVILVLCILFGIMFCIMVLGRKIH